MKKRSRKDEDRARRAQLWSEGELSGEDWIEDERGLPRGLESEQISLRLPRRLLAVIRGFAKRRGIGYQTLLKDWLDDRARYEARRELKRKRPAQDRSHLLLVRPGENLGDPAEDLVEAEEEHRHRKRMVG